MTDKVAGPDGSALSEGLGPTPERNGVCPAIGYKFHAEQVRAACESGAVRLHGTADFIEAQNAEIEYLYRALQRVRDRARRAGVGNKAAASIYSEAEFALKYGQ